MYNCKNCKEDFDVETIEQIKIINAQSKTLSVLCTSCNKWLRLSVGDSKILMEKYTDIEQEIEQKRIETDLSGNEEVDFDTKFKEALEIFGLVTKKNEAKIRAVVKLIERTGASRDWLKYHMQRFNLANRNTIDSIVDVVFLDDQNENDVALPPLPMGLKPQHNSSVMSPGQAMPSNINSGYNVQQLPGGQVLVLPSNQPFQSSQPIIIDRDRNNDDDVDGERIIEELDEKGTVKKRIIRKRTVDTKNDNDNLVSALKLFGELGLIQKQSVQPSISPEIQITLDSLKQTVASMAMRMNDDSHGYRESTEIKMLQESINNMRDVIKKNEEDKRENESKMVKDQLVKLENMIVNIQNNKQTFETPTNLSDSQFSTHTQHRNLQTITDSSEKFMGQVMKPLNQIIENQNKLNGMMMIRDMERNDGVQPGTYMKAISPQPTQTDVQIKSTVQKWQDRAANTPVNPNKK